MGCGASLRGSKDGGDSWATRRANPTAAILNHQKACKPSDFIKAFSIGQAFHTGRKGPHVAPKKLNCSACGQFIVEAPGEQKFYACVSCWKMGHALGICAKCFQNESYCLDDAEPSSPSDAPGTLPRRTSNGSMTGSVGVETVIPPPLATEPNPPSSDSDLEDIDLGGEKKAPSPARRARRESAGAKVRRRSSGTLGTPQRLDTQDLDSPTASEPFGETGRGGKLLSSQNSMKSTQLSTQGSVSSLRRLSSQQSIPPGAISDGSPSPVKSLRRLSTAELQASGPTKSQSAPNLKRRMSLPPIEGGHAAPKAAPKSRTRRMSTQASMKSNPPDGTATASTSTTAAVAAAATPDATPKRKPQARRMSTQVSMKSSGTTGSARRTSVPATGSAGNGAAAEPTVSAEAETAPAGAAKRPGTGGKRRNSAAAEKKAQAAEAKQEQERRKSNAEAEAKYEEERRKSNASQRSLAHLQQRQQAPLPSGRWTAHFVEGRKKHTRKEERHLIFTSEGNVSGAGLFDSTIQGRFKMPNVQWTETYSWGTIKVKAEVMKVPLRLEGTFETSDQGSGFVTFLPADSGV